MLNYLERFLNMGHTLKMYKRFLIGSFYFITFMTYSQSDFQLEVESAAFINGDDALPFWLQYEPQGRRLSVRCCNDSVAMCLLSKKPYVHA